MFIVETYQKHDVRAIQLEGGMVLDLKRIPFTIFLSPEDNVCTATVLGDSENGDYTENELYLITRERRFLTELVFRTYAEYATKDCYEQGKFDVCWLDGMCRAALAMGAYTINADCNKAGMVFFDVFDPNGEQHTEYAEKGKAASLYNQIIKRVEGELDEAWVAGMSWFPHKREN